MNIKILIKKLVSIRRKCVFFLLVLFLLGFTALHIYSKYDYMLYRISAAHARIRNEREFNDGTDKRASLMELPLKHVNKDAKGIYLPYNQVKEQDIATIASIGFVTYYSYPVPIYYRKETSLKKCDYLILRNSTVRRPEYFLLKMGEEDNFRIVDKNKKYVLMKRK